MSTIWRIANWNTTYENNRTRELKKMDWVPIPNRMDGSGYTELVDHPNGAAHLGIWLAIIEIASRCDERGTLSQEGAGGCRRPLTAQHLGRMSHLPAGLFEEVIPRLVEIGWLVEAIDNKTVNGIPHLPAVIPHLPAEECLRARENGTEGNGREEKRKTQHAFRENATPLDEAFLEFREAYTAAGYHGIEADWHDARYHWRKLDWTQKLARVEAARNRNGDPAYFPKPRKFLETDWERKSRAPARKVSHTEALAESIANLNLREES